jgi:putative ABC transport system substrate-binding protein
MVRPPAFGPRPVLRVGVLVERGAERDDRHEALRSGLRDLGWLEGQTIALEWRLAETRAESLAELAAELVALDVALVVVSNASSALAVRQASESVPVVMAGGDALGSGRVANMVRPDRNITGVSNATAELCGKRLELLKEAFPTLSRVAVLFDPLIPIAPAGLRETESAARKLGIRLQPVSVDDPERAVQAFAAMQAEAAEALVIFPGRPQNGSIKARIIEQANRQRLPQIWEADDATAAGGLISYGPDGTEQYRRAALYVDKILRGTRPSELPMELPTRFYLSINLRMARVLGLSIPPAFLQQATEVIQ